MKKIALSIAAAATILVALAACTSSPTATSNSSDGLNGAPGPSALKSAKGTTEIAVWDAFPAVNGQEFQKLIDEFNSTNTDRIHVTRTFQGAYPDLLAKYTASLRSKSAPTLTLVNDVSSGFMVDAGQSIPAADMAKANPGDVTLNNIPAAARNYYSVKGVQQSVPMAMSTPVLWVNRDLLRQAGIADDTDLSTLDEVIAAAKTVHEKTGQFGWTMQDDDWTIENWTATAGQNFCTPDNGRKGKAATGITINTGAAKTAITKIIDLYTGGVALDGAADGSAAIAAFNAGKVAFMPYGSGLLGTLKAGSKINYQALPFPASSSKYIGNTTIGGASMWLSKQGTKAQQVAGWKLEAFLNSAKSQEAWSHITGYVPTNTTVEKSSTQQAFLSANPPFQVFIKQINASPVKTPTAGCLSGAMTSIRAGIISQLQGAYAGSKSADAALDAAVSNAKTVIGQYQAQLGN